MGNHLFDMADATTTTQTILLQSIRAYAGTESPERLQSMVTSDVNWEYLLRLADLHNVKPFIASVLSGIDAIPAPTRQAMKKITYGAMRNHLDYRKWIVGIFAAMVDAGIRPVVLKGPALADRYYPDPHLRASVDLDLLLEPNDLIRASELLVSSGYACSGSLPGDIARIAPGFVEWHDLEIIDGDGLHEQHISLAKPGKLIEIHWRPSPERLCSISSVGTMPMQIEGVDVLVPSPEDQLVLCILHSILHGWGTGSLRNLLDIALVLRSHVGWDKVIERIYGLKCRGYAYHLLEWVADEIGISAPKDIMEAIRPSPRAAWYSRPPRRFDEVLALADSVKFTEKLHDMVHDLKGYKKHQERLLFMTGTIFPPSEVVRQRLGTPSRGVLYANCAAWPLLMLYRALRKKGSNEDATLG